MIPDSSFDTNVHRADWILCPQEESCVFYRHKICNVSVGLLLNLGVCLFSDTYRSLFTHIQVSFHTYIGLFSHILSVGLLLNLGLRLFFRCSSRLLDYFHTYIGLFSHVQVSFHTHRSLFTHVGLFSHIYRSLFTHTQCLSQVVLGSWTIFTRIQVSFHTHIDLLSHIPGFGLLLNLGVCLCSHTYRSLFTHIQVSFHTYPVLGCS